METLLDAMLVLSRAGRATLNLQTVSLQRLVDQAQKDVTLMFPDVRVAWTIDPLPTVQGDAATLQQVFGHLLNNAVKYSPGQAEVRVWSEEREQDWAILVKDRGVGFDPLYAGKLFGAFQRLVARHGGQVWAEGRVGKGAAFGFSLPKKVLS